MCSTYETGQFTGDVPLALDGDGIGPVASVGDLRLIRRTDLAPVYLKDEGMVSMRWGYERSKLGVVNNTASSCDQLPIRVSSSSLRLTN